LTQTTRSAIGAESSPTRSEGERKRKMESFERNGGHWAGV